MEEVLEVMQNAAHKDILSQEESAGKEGEYEIQRAGKNRIKGQ